MPWYSSKNQRSHSQWLHNLRRGCWALQVRGNYYVVGDQCKVTPCSLSSFRKDHPEITVRTNLLHCSVACNRASLASSLNLIHRNLQVDEDDEVNTEYDSKVEKEFVVTLTEIPRGDRDGSFVCNLPASSKGSWMNPANPR